VDQVFGNTGNDRITDYAQHELGDVVLSNCRRWAAKLAAWKIIWHDRIRQGGQRTLRPVSGEVIETNAALSNAPETVNSDRMAPRG